MSSDEDTELRDLVAQTLESNGVLGKIRAQLRANVFLALEEQESVKSTATPNTALKTFVETREGKLATSLVREFLTYFNLDFTVAVFDPETTCTDVMLERPSLAKDLDLEADESEPLLSALLRRRAEDHTRKSRSEELNPKDIALAKKKFEEYDEDNSGFIEKDELRALFCDIFPSFPPQMLDRYVNDEFRAADKDFSNAIDIEEFMDMYRRLFVQCRSVVSRDVMAITSPRTRIPAPAPVRQVVNGENSAASQSIPENKSSTHGVAKGDITKPESAAPSLGNSTQSKTRQASDSDDDSVFGQHRHGIIKENKSEKHGVATSPRASQIPVKSRSDKKEAPTDSGTKKANPPGTDMSSLAGLPSLSGGTKEQQAPKVNGLEKDLRASDRKAADLGLEMGNDYDYDEDFESSNVSPMGPTPRSARSDHNVKSLEEDIEEDIDDDLSVAEELLASDDSLMDDLTTDRTVSPTEQSAAFDYAEDIPQA